MYLLVNWIKSFNLCLLNQTFKQHLHQGKYPAARLLVINMDTFFDLKFGTIIIKVSTWVSHSVLILLFFVVYLQFLKMFLVECALLQGGDALDDKTRRSLKGTNALLLPILLFMANFLSKSRVYSSSNNNSIRVL